ncbi:Cysteinyl-tRNA synthetase [Hordeum vulgare]|nr:Cysteinyl-tRNA synthetase [Hordeum vulgare]
MKVADPEEDEAKQPASGFNMAEMEAEFAIAQAKEMAEQQAILKSIRDEIEVEANRELLRQKEAEADVHFGELEADMKEEDETGRVRGMELHLSLQEIC